MTTDRMARRRFTCTLTLMQGAEPWMRVEYDDGRSFKVPADTTVMEVLTGLRERWTLLRLNVDQGEPMVRVPYAAWIALNATGSRSGCD
jgi:hypothetical protein